MWNTDTHTRTRTHTHRGLTHSAQHAYKTLIWISVCPFFSPSTLPSNLNKPSHIITANSVYFHVHFPETLRAEQVHTSWWANSTRMLLNRGENWMSVFYWFRGRKVRATQVVLSFTRSEVQRVWSVQNAVHLICCCHEAMKTLSESILWVRKRSSYAECGIVVTTWCLIFSKCQNW